MRKEDALEKNMITGKALFKKNSLLWDFSIMIILCFAGLIVKKLINPAANMVTDALHVPGGISTAFSLMFLVVASGMTTRKWTASVMGSMQALAALSIGMVGSMGILMPLAYIVPGVFVDIVMAIPDKGIFVTKIKAFLANILSSVAAALVANIFVFHLPFKPLLVYILLASLSGAVCGFVAGAALESAKKIAKGKKK